MEKKEFQDMIDRYKNEMMKMANENSQIQDENNFSETYEEIPEKDINEVNNLQDINSDEYDGTPYTGKATMDYSENETYQEFLDKNKDYGYLKVQAFAARQALPVEGVNVIVSKKFSDEEKIFFEGKTDSSGIIDNIKLPAPSKMLSESPQDVLPYAGYDFYTSYEGYQTEDIPDIQIFQGVKTIQPVKVIL